MKKLLFLILFSSAAQALDLDNSTVETLRNAAKKAGARIVFVVDPPGKECAGKVEAHAAVEEAHATAEVPAVHAAAREPASDKGCRLVSSKSGDMLECRE